MEKRKISIAICTYNRDYFLDLCLSSIYKFNGDKDNIEIIVIDNNSIDNTRPIVKRYQLEHSNLLYFKEEEIGLSHARNRAIKESNAKFIAFIDDDLKISDNYIERLIWAVDNYEFDCLGGMYYPWYIEKKPKWISKDFGQKEKLLDSIGKLKSEYISGGNMVFPTTKIKELGGFPINFGMKGDEIRYGEEDYVQNIIREQGGTIIFDPDLIVYHAVQKYKFSLKWRFKSIYTNTKSNYIIHPTKGEIYSLLYQLIKSIIAAIFKRLPLGFLNLTLNKNYYYQNLILSTFKPVIINYGKIIAYFSLSKFNDYNVNQSMITNLEKKSPDDIIFSQKIKVSIVICTYNRSFFLDKCLNSLYKYSANQTSIEIMVVDNNSVDNTKLIVEEYQNKYNNLTYYKETKVGLSHARNRAIEEAKASNIAYLDDDVKVSESYINRLLWVIETFKYDCFGGMYYPWYLKEKPKWISPDFGKKEMLLNSIGILKKEYVTGLNMVYTKDILKSIGGFPVELGMIGNDIGYGEEDYVQHEIRERGGIILFDPDLYVYHAVLDFKQSLVWQLKSIFINSKTNFIIHKKNENVFYLIFLLFKSLAGALLKRLPFGLYKLLFHKNYYYQNLILEILTPVLTISGRLKVLIEKDSISINKN